jgi:hypothetical protein
MKKYKAGSLLYKVNIYFYYYKKIKLWHKLYLLIYIFLGYRTSTF